ncbi:MAG: 3'-5' exonuclease [Clostridia bacterium]|nr:3'-5' exonuclease [Clostridia bacterium]
MTIFLDTETTGLNPGQICQLSYIIQDGQIVQGKNFFFSVDYVEYGALAVHGFSKERLEILSGGKGFECFIDQIEQDFLSADLVCAHNTAFDFKFLRREFERCRKDFMVNAEFCTMKNSVTTCKLIRPNSGGYKYPRLNELCVFLGITDNDIQENSRKIFGESAGYHDARFDTVALYLAFNTGVLSIENFAKFKDKL